MFKRGNPVVTYMLRRPFMLSGVSTGCKRRLHIWFDKNQENDVQVLLRMLRKCCEQGSRFLVFF
jgi:hypothetical protein